MYFSRTNSSAGFCWARRGRQATDLPVCLRSWAASRTHRWSQSRRTTRGTAAGLGLNTHTGPGLNPNPELGWTRLNPGGASCWENGWKLRLRDGGAQRSSQLTDDSLPSSGFTRVGVNSAHAPNRVKRSHSDAFSRHQYERWNLQVDTESEPASSINYVWNNYYTLTLLQAVRVVTVQLETLYSGVVTGRKDFLQQHRTTLSCSERTCCFFEIYTRWWMFTSASSSSSGLKYFLIKSLKPPLCWVEGSSSAASAWAWDKWPEPAHIRLSAAVQSELYWLHGLCLHHARYFKPYVSSLWANKYVPTLLTRF